MEFVKKMQGEKTENAYFRKKNHYVKKITIKNEGCDSKKFIQGAKTEGKSRKNLEK